jgi:DNA (cytosine-5)-methyltransferase 1
MKQTTYIATTEVTETLSRRGSAGSHWDDPSLSHPTLNQSAKGTGQIGYSNQEVFSQRGAGIVPQPVVAPTLTASNDPSRSPQSTEVTQQVAAVLAAMPTMAVRRLLPVECERLQGFPDDHTNIPWRGKPAPDGPRYKAMGNSFAVPVVRWIGQRLDRVTKGVR